MRHHDADGTIYSRGMPIAVIADSSACLPSALVDAHHITIVPLSLLIDSELYQDGAIPDREFYARLRASRSAASTTSPAPGEFLEAFRRARESGSAAALCLTLPASFSGTYGAAVSAQQLARRDLPDFPVRIVDTGGLAMAHGFAVLAAARAGRAGASLDECAEAAEAVAAQAHLIGVLNSTRYLAQSGRVPWIVHWAASLLHIKPVLAAAGSKVGAVGRARTLKAATDGMLAYVADRVCPGARLHIAVMHAEAPVRADELAALVRERFSPAELIVTEFTSVMGVHTGPGFVGLAFYSDESTP